MTITKEEFAELMRKRGYTSDRSHDGLDRQKLGMELGRTYHAVRNWLNGTNPVPVYAFNYLTATARQRRGSSASQHIPGTA